MTCYVQYVKVTHVHSSRRPLTLRKARRVVTRLARRYHIVAYIYDVSAGDFVA